MRLPLSPEEVALRKQFGGLCAVVSAFVVLVSCGGGSGGGPNNPSPTPTSITITSTGATMFLGQTETFSATFTLNNGNTQIVSGGTWGTDAPGVATVNPATGLVTAVGRGDVTIFIDAQGLRGTKRITVNVTYSGTWSGSYRFTSCSHSGDLAALDFCGLFPIGLTDSVVMTLTQTGSTVTGRTALDGLTSGQFSTPIAADGGLTFTAVFTDGVVTISQAWQVNIAQSGQMTGTVVQTWTGAGLNGNGVVSGTIQTVTRQPGDALRRGIGETSVARAAALLKRR